MALLPDGNRASRPQNPQPDTQGAEDDRSGRSGKKARSARCVASCRHSLTIQLSVYAERNRLDLPLDCQWLFGECWWDTCYDSVYVYSWPYSLLFTALQTAATTLIRLIRGNLSVLITPTSVAGVKRSSASVYVCVFFLPQHNSKTNDSKVFKVGIWNKLGISWFLGQKVTVKVTGSQSAKHTSGYRVSRKCDHHFGHLEANQPCMYCRCAVLCTRIKIFCYLITRCHKNCLKRKAMPPIALTEMVLSRANF